MIDKALKKFSESIVENMQENLVKNDSVRTGTLYRSINSTVSGNTINIEMIYYGEFVDEGHKTRKSIRTDKPRELTTLTFVKPKPFINNSIETSYNEALPILVDDLLVNLNKK